MRVQNRLVESFNKLRLFYGIISMFVLGNVQSSVSTIHDADVMLSFESDPDKLVLWLHSVIDETFLLL